MPLSAELLTQIKYRKGAIQRYLLQWSKKNFRIFPWRINRTPYSVLIAEILLKRTTATAVAAIFEKFLRLYPNSEALANADKDSLESLLSRIGYHKKRASDLVKIASVLLKEFRGELPKSKKELMSIPFIGHYTANAILSLGYGNPAAMVDSNVTRIIRRLFSNHLAQKSSTNIIQLIADNLVPMRNHQVYNLALLDFGAVICTYGIPKCSLCPLNRVCDYFLAGNASR